MLADIIKFYFIFFCCTYTYLKIIPLNIKYILNRKLFIYLCPCILIIILSLFHFNFIFPLLFLWCITSPINKQPLPSFVAVFISFGISYGLGALTNLLLIIVIFPIQHINPILPNCTLSFIAGISQTVLNIKICHYKRFQKGMPFLISTNFVNIATLICFILLIFLSYIPSTNVIFEIKPLSFLIFFGTLAILIYWWQSQLTKTYKQRLILRELESLRTEVQEKDKRIAILEEQNQELGRLIHRDNKRIPAMENAVIEYLSTDFDEKLELKEKGLELRQEIQQLSTSRANKLADINRKRSKSYATEITSLDTLLNYMSRHAAQNSTQLSVHTAVDLKEYIPRCITTEDFTHMLSDLLDNACIACAYSSERNIQLQFYVSEDVFVAEIADSGIPFEPETLANFGLSRQTTHSDSGGSGIGLMDIWRIKEKYRATLHIEEYENESPYTKKISILFNKKNRFTIQTYRKEKFLQKIERSDLQIYNYGV